MADAPLLAHSLTEIRLYLMVKPCESCHQGALRFVQARAVQDEDPGPIRLWWIDVSCTACGTTATFTFHLPRGSLVADPPNHEKTSPKINPQDTPSRIIDVAEWLTLFRMVTEEAGRESDKVEARELGIEAAQCLEEALKFYDEPDNNLPPEEAFFHEGSLKRFRENPQEFSRQRLIDLRSKLPKRSADCPLASSESEPPKKPRWWRRRQ